MQTNLSAELARLNELQKACDDADAVNAKLPHGGHKYDTSKYAVLHFPIPLLELRKAAPDAVALANQLHALLLQAQGALLRYQQARGIDATMSGAIPTGQWNRDELRRAWEQSAEALAALQAAGIGGEYDK